MSRTIHVICNSHMDPVWQWRMRDGRAAWLNTCRTVVRMMQKYPFLKFTRSSSACYRWIEECDPGLFRQIRRLADEGRWEPVGGWIEQSDTIIASGESLLRQAEYAKRYFQDKFGRDIRTAYSVDSFGQNIGLPKLLRASGFDYYAWMRPQQHEKEMPFLFRWQCDDGDGSILCLRIRHAYTTQPEIPTPEAFRQWFDRATAGDAPHQTFFFGIGDHGGGIYEKQLLWLLKIAEDTNLVFSTLEDYFHALERQPVPTVTGEHTHHSPGCYSAMHGIKAWMAEAESNLLKAEKITLQSPAADRKRDLARLDQAWEEMLFNYFHDVYSGTCIREAYDHELRDICGMANKTAADILEKNLCRMGANLRTDFLTEGGLLLWNPLPRPNLARAQYDTFTDPNKCAQFNAVADASGRILPLQWIRAAVPGITEGRRPWWGRAVVVDQLPASGVQAYAYTRTTKQFPALGFAAQKALAKRIRFQVLDDPNDTWAHAARRLGETIGEAELVKTDPMEDGPNVSRLRCHYRWGNSAFHLDLFAWRGTPELSARLEGDWNEPRKALKLALDAGRVSGTITSGQALATIERTPDDCEQPFQRFVAAGGTGFIAGDLHSYDSVTQRGRLSLRLTVVRPVFYSEHHPWPPHGDEGIADLGQFQRSFWLFTGGPDNAAALAERAQSLLESAEYLEITAAPEARDRQYDLWSVTPECVTVAAQRLIGDGKAQFHLHNPAHAAVTAVIRLNGRAVARRKLAPGTLAMVEITPPAR